MTRPLSYKVCPECKQAIKAERWLSHRREVHGVRAHLPSTREQVSSRKQRTHGQCPKCGARVRPDRLSRHLAKVHGRRRRSRRQLDAVPPTDLDVTWTDDLYDQCAAITAAGSRCTRRIAVQVGSIGYCKQHSRGRSSLDW